MIKRQPITRRTALRVMGAGVAGMALAPHWARGDARDAILKPIPPTGEEIPVIGLGTWRTFNVGDDERAYPPLVQVVEAFFDEGGGMIDCSPMYGSAHNVLQYSFEQLGRPDTLFSADKIWTREGRRTRAQFREIADWWGVETIDLMQVHNLVAWEPHLETLREMKAEGEVRYIGITTSHGRRHADFARIMETEDDIDFVQLTYNITHPEVERRLLPLAEEKGIAVIANRPYDGGSLVRRLKQDAPLPEWADEVDCHDWPQFLLKWIVSHPAVTCAIPATSRVEHLRENMDAGRGRLPDAEQRNRMGEYVRAL